jgi:hypothetical protein
MVAFLAREGQLVNGVVAQGEAEEAAGKEGDMED